MSFFAAAPRRPSRFSAGNWLLALACLAMLCRALMPAGYMPAAQDGMQWLALCSGSGQTRVVAVTLFETQDTRQSDGGPQAAHCVFAAQASGAALPPPAPVVFGALPPQGGVRLLATPATVPPYLERGAPLGARAPPLPRLV